MQAASRTTVAATALVALALFAAVPLTRGGHATASSAVQALPQTVLPRVSQEEFEARWSGDEPKKVEERAPSAARPAAPRPAVMPPVLVAGRKGDRHAAASGCDGQTWPYIAPDCMSDAASGRPRVRTITLEQRHEAATSTLVRAPLTTLTQR